MTREQDLLGDINARWIKSDLIREVLTSGERQALDDITYLLARVATLEAELNQQFIDQSETVWTRPTAEAYALTCKALHAAQATNAQRDARLVKLGLEMAAQLHHKEGMRQKREWDAYLATNPQGPATTFHTVELGWAKSIRALATDDAAIQAPVEE